MVRRAFPLLLLLSCGACGAGQPEAADASGDAARARRGTSRGGGLEVPALGAAKLGELPAGTYGPYLGAGLARRIVVWAAPIGGQGRAWYALSLTEEGTAQAKPLRVAEAPAEVGLVAVRAGGGGASRSEIGASGFVLVSTDPGVGHEVRAIGLGPTGELRGGPTLLSQPDGPVLWVDAVPTSVGSLVLWAVQRDDRAEIHAAPLGSAAELRGEAHVVLGDVRAWQVAQIPGGAALATVGAGGGRGTTGSVQVLLLDESGGKVSESITVSAEPTAGLDLDMVRVGSSLVLGWSDRRRIEPRLYLAALDARGTVRQAPTPAVRGIGSETLIALVAPFDAAGPAYLAWERPSDRSAAGRSIHLAPVDQHGVVGKARAIVDLAEDDSVPEFRSTPNGLAALTLAPACPRGQRCDEPPTVPTFVQFGSELELLGSEPLRLESLDGSAVSLAWGLACSQPGCIALGALERSPAPVFAVRLEPRSARWQPAGRQVAPAVPPTAVTMEAIAELDPVHDVAAVTVGDSTLAAWVTYFDPTTPWERRKTPAPDGRFDPLRALLQVQAFSGGEGERAPIETISIRARSLAGVELVAGPSDQTGALLVWSAIDRKQPQVFLTVLDARGKKQRQAMLTHTRGEVSDIAAADVADAWLVSWVDESSGDPEVYVTRVNRRLRRETPVVRLTEAPGTATGVVMHAAGQHTQLAWADARDPAQPGYADIFTVRVRNQDAKPEGKAEPLARTPAHSFAPTMAAFGQHLVLAWLERGGPSESAEPRCGVQLAELDAAGHVVAPPAFVELDMGEPTSLALDCVEQSCRVVVSMETEHRCELYGFSWTSGSQPTVQRLVSLSGPAGQAVAPALSGNHLFFADRTVEREGRVHRMLIDWSE